jgi:uncharacterized Fe-S cluster protein YjdI
MVTPLGEPGASQDAQPRSDVQERALDDRLPAQSDSGEESRGRRYRADGITVYFDARRCWHSGVCVRGLPAVFDVKRRPWIDAAADTAEVIAARIDLCPSGALSYDLG